MRLFITSLIMTVVLTLLLGIVYPLAMTGVAQLLFPTQANGSMVEVNGKVVGSALIGQSFSSPKFFASRPSAAGTGYDPLASGASNLGPTSKALMDRVTHDVDSLRLLHPDWNQPLPGDMLTTSASGLDPDISVANALLQAPQVAKANAIEPEKVKALVERQIEGRSLGFLGEPHLNVLALNIELLKLTGQAAHH